MKDSVNKLFQQRFQGHEAPVDPGVWQGIQQQMAASAPAADGVSELFKERFQGHESNVDPSAWANISGQLGHAAAAGTAVSTVWGWVAAGVAAVAVTAGVLLWEPTVSTPDQELAETAVQVRAAELPGNETLTGAKMTEQPTTTNAQTSVVPVQRTTPENEAYPVRKPRAKTQAPGMSTAAPATTAPTGTVETAPERVVGQVLVADIINNLTERVVQQPLTAQPEPGLSKEVQTPTSNGDNSGSEASSVPVPEPEAPLPVLFMPNTFTPNGDLVNDTYTVGTEGFQSVMIRVYSLKSNTLVFSTNNGEAWTGANCEDGMYMVAAEARAADGRTVSEGKVVWLNRNPINY